jgi:ectoine hydroxylase-related dioxygenase (phytanoyl-CoA dioxygenase family)
MKSEVRSQKSERNGFDRFVDNGFQIIPRLISDLECDLLASELSTVFESQQNFAQNKIGGVRNLFKNGLHVAELATSARLVSILEKFLGQKAFPVRAIFFDKTAESNWWVPWHQDLSIAVAKQIETPGFTAWSIKEGILHVTPPREILESMATVRVHLDKCDADNGALKIIPGTHLCGKFEGAQIAALAQNEEAVICEVPKGGALLIRPLLLHSSSPAKNPSHRRVLHIEFATDELPNGLKWFERQ